MKKRSYGGSLALSGIAAMRGLALFIFPSG
jgi:hypothetical protein